MKIRYVLTLIVALLLSATAVANLSEEKTSATSADNFMLLYNDVNVGHQAEKYFIDGFRLSLMMMPSRYNDALYKLDQAKKFGHPYASVAILFTNALAKRQRYVYDDYAQELNLMLEGSEPLGITLAALTIIEATDFLKHNDARIVLDALNRALAQHYVPSWYVKGLLLIKLGRHSTGIDEIKQASDLEYAVAQYHMAFLILSGHLKMDKVYAFDLLQKAMKGGHWAAYRELGVCYERGIGTRIDLERAIEMYRQGYSHGDIIAAASYGLLLLQQKQPNYLESFNALSFAYNNGVKEVANALGTLYLRGLGVMMDQKQGFELIKTAADRNDILAINNLIVCYQNGTGTKVDLAKAQQYQNLLHKLKREQDMVQSNSKIPENKITFKQRSELKSDSAKNKSQGKLKAEQKDRSLNK